MGITLGRRALRAIVGVGAVLLLLIDPSVAQAATKNTSFLYGPDSINWYWKDQVERTVGTGPVAQVVTLGNPQAPDTLPVALENGKPDKISAIAFDLTDRDVPVGSKISTFVFTIAESDDVRTGFSDPSQPDAQPSFNTDGKLILACPITSVWASGEGAELWDRAPSYASAGCVTGKRSGSGQSLRWTFDLTPLAQDWSDDPVQNGGVMLVPGPVQGKALNDRSWQINLKIPMRDNADTAGTDEYQSTKSRVTVQVGFVPPAPTSGPNAGSGFGGTSGIGGLSGSGGGLPSSNPFPFGTPGATGGGSPTPAPGQSPALASRPAPTVPHLPWYIWILIPVGLVAVSTVRAVVLEPFASGKPGGVIIAIRTRNAELRGMGSRGSGFATRRSRRPAPAFLSLGTMGRRGWERVSSAAGRTRRRLRR
jgi:hypothetical protein